MESQIHSFRTSTVSTRSHTMKCGAVCRYSRQRKAFSGKIPRRRVRQKGTAMTLISRRTVLTQASIGAGGLAIASIAGAGKSYASSAATSDDKKADIVFHGTGFAPMVAHVIAGQDVTIASKSDGDLKIATAPGSPEKIAGNVKAGAHGALKFAKPGLYLIYDDATTYFDDKVKQVAARKSSKNFPLPAYLIVLVTDEQGRGLKATDGKIDIPDSYMTFEPWVTVVNAGDPITFVNDDMDMHIVMPSPEPMLMPKSNGGEKLEADLWSEKMNAFDPVTLNGHGGKGVVTIAQPGLHHYFCPVHTAYNPNAFTFAPLKSFGGYPFIMDGVIVVLPT